MISFIIPAYNASKTIKRAINSILNQSDRSLDYEIIVVDDGSTDDLRKVINEYPSSDSQYIRYYKKENGGLSDARNFGIKKAKGDYLIFVDSDDYVSRKLLKDIKKYINKGFDLIKWNAVLVDENDERIDSPEQNDLVSCTGEDGFNLLYGTDKLLCCVWNYAIKKDIMIDFPEGMYHEDFRVMPFIMLNAKSMIITNKEKYFYVQSKNSIMRTSDKKKEKKKMQDILKHYDAMVKQVNKMDVENETKENMAIYATYSVLAVLNNDLDKKNREYYLKEIKKRKMYKNIKVRNLKSFIKRILYAVKY